MTRTVRIQGEAAQFPQLCANCLAPATQHIPLSGERARGRHRERREFEVPFCDACHDLYQGNTPFHRAVEAATKRMPIAMISMIVSGVLILVFGATGFAMSLNALARDRLAWPWVVSGAFAVLLVASGVIWYTSRRTVEATLPSEEAAAKDCVHIPGFTIETTDISFANDTYADGFQKENPGSSFLRG